MSDAHTLGRVRQGAFVLDPDGANFEALRRRPG
jgi:hypothetical protein